MVGGRYLEDVVRRLKETGLKVTPQRLAVIRCLEGNSSHPSAEQIHRAVTRSFPAISLATVYNTLETLEKIEAVRSVYLTGGRRHYDPEMRPHHHAVCRRCQRIEDVFPETGDPVPVPATVRGRFAEVTPMVLYRGTCADCASSSSP